MHRDLTRPTRPRRGLLALAVALLITLVTQASAAGAAGVMIAPPPNAASSPNAIVTGLSCATSTYCVAVGSYRDASGDVRGMVSVYTGESWGQAVAITPPAVPTSGTWTSGLAGVTCPSAGSCLAVGYDQQDSDDDALMTVTIAGGQVDTTGTAVGLPADALRGDANNFQTASLTSVSCPGAGSGACLATGYYMDSNGYRQTLLASGAVSGLTSSSEIALPGDAAAPGSDLWPQSNESGPLLVAAGCSDPGTCIAVGDYPSSRSASGISLMSTAAGASTAGEMTTATAPSAITGQGTGALAAIACPGTGDCEAAGGVGGYPMVLSQAPNGVWGQETALSTTLSGTANAITCPDINSCIAAGNLYGNGPFIATEQSGGSWTAPQNDVPDPDGSIVSGSIDAAACPPGDTADCWVGGDYTTTSSGAQEGYVSQVETSDNGGSPTPPSCQALSASTTTGTPVTITLKCTDAQGAALTYATNASPVHGSLGAINQTTAQITYTPAGGFSGTDTFTYHASSTNGSAVATTVTITVTAPARTPTTTTTTGTTTTTTTTTGSPSGGTATRGTPHLTHTALSGVSGGHPTLVLALASSARPIVSLTVELPAGISFVKSKLARGLSLARAKPNGPVRLSGASLTVKLHGAVSSLTVTLARGALVISPSELKKLKRHRVRTLRFGVKLGLRGGATVTLSSSVTV